MAAHAIFVVTVSNVSIYARSIGVPLPSQPQQVPATCLHKNDLFQALLAVLPMARYGLAVTAFRTNDITVILLDFFGLQNQRHKRDLAFIFETSFLNIHFEYNGLTNTVHSRKKQKKHLANQILVLS